MPRLLLLLLWACLAILNVAASVFLHGKDQSIPVHTGDRSKRSTCAAKFRTITNTHTACLPGSSASAVTVADQALILNRHNKYRANANPPAANMLKMVWDDEVAMIAQKWAENCELKHDNFESRTIPDRFALGQNIALSKRDEILWENTVDMWHSQSNNFQYGADNNSLFKIEQYTQIMWATSSIIGCGVHACPSGMMYVCNYAPPGNMDSNRNKPYVKGTPCSQCPNRCVNSALCDCGSLVCLNGGSLDMASCSCNCLVQIPLVKNEDCSLDCSAPDAADCKDKAIDMCPGIALECPVKCGFCLAASMDLNSSPRIRDTVFLLAISMLYFLF